MFPMTRARRICFARDGAGALQDDQPIQEHLKRHKYWKDKWPDALVPEPE
jgi:hypothetical protein